MKLTISERFTVDISHDRLVMRFSRIKDSRRLANQTISPNSQTGQPANQRTGQKQLRCQAASQPGRQLSWSHGLVVSPAVSVHIRCEWCNKIAKHSPLLRIVVAVRQSPVSMSLLLLLVLSVSMSMATAPNGFVKRKLIKIMSFRANVTSCAPFVVLMNVWPVK